MKQLEQLAGALGAFGVIVAAITVLLVWIDRTTAKKIEEVRVWPFIAIGTALIGIAVLLMICHHGIKRNDPWAPRAGRRIGQGLAACPVVWLVLMISPLPIGPVGWQILLLGALLMLGFTAYGMSRDMTAAIELIDSVRPPERGGFDPVMPVAPLVMKADLAQAPPHEPADYGTDSVRAK